MRILEILDVRTLLLLALVFLPLEHLFPIHRNEKAIRESAITDLLHFLVSAFLSRLGMFAVIVTTMHGTQLMLPPAIHATVQAWPIWIQVLVGTVIADLGFYVSHRLMHSVPWLWNFHAVHHSSEKLDWLAAYRVHPVDQTFVKGTSLAFVFVCGFSEAAIVIMSLIYFWQSILVHSNVRIDIGPLKWLVATPQFHHWHHSNHPEAYDKNFSGQLLLWDLAFGTVHQPGNAVPSRYGVDDPVPQSYPQQLAYPFRRMFSHGPGRMETTPPDPEPSGTQQKPTLPPAAVS